MCKCLHIGLLDTGNRYTNRNVPIICTAEDCSETLIDGPQTWALQLQRQTENTGTKIFKRKKQDYRHTHSAILWVMGALFPRSETQMRTCSLLGCN